MVLHAWKDRELAARRAALGVDVASAKFLAGRDIEDPDRFPAAVSSRPYWSS
jgi:chorismate mutase